MNNQFLLFRSIATIVLSAMVGLLAAIPLVQPNGTATPLALMFLGGALGAFAGYRRRTSHLFFYFTLFATATLATILFFNLL